MLVVLGPYPPPMHGASRIAQAVVEGVEARGGVVRVMSTTVTGRAYHLRRLVKYVWFALEVARLKRRVGRTRLYQTGAGGSALYYQALVALVARVLRVPQVFHHHSYAYLNARSRAMRMLVWAGGAQMVHIALCEGMGRKLREDYFCDRVMCFSNALLVGFEPDVARPERAEFVVGHLSNLCNEKGLGLVLSAVDCLRASGMDLQLEVAGPAATPQVQLQLEAHIAQSDGLTTWHGALHVDKVPQFMRGIDCLLFPSQYRNEASPLVVLEALREGTPVLATDVGCLGEVLGASGWLVEPTVPSLVSGVTALMEETDRHTSARRIFNRQFERVSRDMFFETVIGS